MREDSLAYYAEPGPMTALDLPPKVTEGLPGDPLALCGVAQGLIVHEFWAATYGLEIPPARLDELETRAVSDMVEVIEGLDPGPLVDARPPERRMVGNCRHFSTLSCALLRRAGIPARARCGFATYFEPERYIDHWIVEYWDSTSDRWRRVDSQIDEAQRGALSLDFDSTDVPSGQFVPGGEAWHLCRAGRADPDRFGILDFWGTWFVRNNVVRDLAALNKMELLPWDGWGLMDRVAELGEDATDRVVDEIADATLTDDSAEVRRLYERSDLLRVPAAVTSYRTGATVTLSPAATASPVPRTPPRDGRARTSFPGADRARPC
jgi:hypothetical protein